MDKDLIDFLRKNVNLSKLKTSNRESKIYFPEPDALVFSKFEQILVILV